MIKSFFYRIKKNPFKYFFFKLILLFIVVFACDYSIGNILSYLYYKQQSGLQYRTTFSIESTTSDILIFGSSRANHHYHPDIFEKRLNLSYYNVGRDGNFIFYHSAVLKGVLKRYSPKIVILDFISGEFLQDQESYDRLSSLLPYYWKHPEMRSIINLKSKYERIKMASNIYPFNSTIFTIAVGNTEFNKKRKVDIKGYVPLNDIWNGPIQIDSSPYIYKIDSNKIKAYESFIEECIHSKTKLYIVCSPYFIKFTHTDYSVKLGREIAQRNNIIFLDYSNDSIFTNNSKMFADVAHLNDSGARVFTNILINDIVRMINIKEISSTLPKTWCRQ